MKRLLCLLLCLALLGLSACGGQEADKSSGEPDGGGTSAIPEEREAVESAVIPEDKREPIYELPVQPPDELETMGGETEPLTGPPALELVWEAGGADAVYPANSEWSFDGGVMIACGMAPTDAFAHLEPIGLPEPEGALCTLRWAVMPDEITVTGWTSEDAQPEGVLPDENGVYELLPGRAYEIAAVWSEEAGSQRGFFGSAGYICLFESS